ncbi:MAG: hypothetical protein KGI49_00155 [Patescibacteria group bacterium]|nr:hypothetical protein [Patescibacteria group bacterium]
MKEDVVIRVILDIVLAVSIIFGWWFVFVPLGLLCLWMFPYYAELIAAGFLYDSLFDMDRGLGVVGFSGIIITAVITVAFSVLKLVVRWN